MASDVADSAAPSHAQSVLLPPAVARIAEVWPSLPPHIQEAILTLVDAGKTCQATVCSESAAVRPPQGRPDICETI